MGGDWRDGFEYAWQAPDPEPDEGPGLTWRQLTPRHWSGTWESKIRGTVTRDADGWFAYLRLEDPPGLSPITTVGRFPTLDEALVATDEVWVLLAAAMFDLASLTLLVIADTMPLLVTVFALQGVYRALESGPLDAWYVDAAQAVEPNADIEGALGASGAVIGVAIAVGTVTSSGLVALDPFPAINTLVIPLLAALVLRTLDLVSIWRLMIEPACPHARELISGLPTIVRDSVRLIRRSHILLALIAIELLWGAGMVAFETFTPLRLESVVGDPEDAAALLGPTNAVAWLASAGAAAAAPWLIRRAGAPLAGAAMRVAQGITVTGLALFSGPAGVLLAYLATMAMHGAANPVHQSLLHWAVTEPRHRATVLSANSLTGHLGWGIGAIGLGVLADAASLTIGILAGAALLAIAAPLYVVAREPPPPERATPQPSSRPAPPSRSRA